MENDLSISFDMDELLKEKERRNAQKTAAKPITKLPNTERIKPPKVDKYGIKQFNFQQESNKIILELNFEKDVPPELAPQILEVVQKYLKRAKS